MSAVMPAEVTDVMLGWDAIDRVEGLIARELPPLECPLTHRFTPGLYVREIFMPAGALLTSKIHKTEHPYVISQGVVDVYIPGVGVERIRAPHTGITKPGTRRLLYIVEDTIWTTFHPTTLTDVDEIETEIIEPHHNPLLEGVERKEIA